MYSVNVYIDYFYVCYSSACANEDYLNTVSLCVYLYICKWPLAINFADMPINIFFEFEFEL